MPLFGRKKGKGEIEEIIEYIKNAKNTEEVESLEGKLAELENRYSWDRIYPLYREFARKYYELGKREKSFYYAEESNERDIILNVLYDENKCDDILTYVNLWKDFTYAHLIIKCYFNTKNYKKVIESYDEIYRNLKNNEILYYAMESMIKTGEVRDIEKIYNICKDDNDYYATLVKGRYMELRGDYKNAIKFYEESLKIKDGLEAKYGLARCKYYLGDLKYVEKIIYNLPRDDVRTKCLKALVGAKKGMVKESLSVIDDVLNKEESVEAILAKAMIMSEHGIEGSEKYLEDILKIEKYNPIALELYGKVMEKKDKRKARELYEKLLEINKDNINAYLGLARILEGEEREKYARKVLEIDSKNEEAKILLAEEIVETDLQGCIDLLKDIEDSRAFYLLARAYKNIGDRKLAEEYIRKALEMDRKNVNYKFFLAKLIADVRKEEAEEILREVLKERDSVEGRKILAGIIYSEHPEEALDLLKDEEDRASLNLKVKILRRLGRVEDAKKLLEKIVKGGGSVEEYLTLAEMSEEEDAIEILNNILKKEPENEKARITLGGILVNRDPKKALSLVEGIEDERALKISGLAYKNLGDYQNAIEKFKKCENVECMENLIECGIESGKYEDMVEYGKKLVQIKGDKNSLILLARIYEGIDSNKAYETYRRISLQYPDDVEILKKLVEYGEKLGKKEVEDYYQKLYDTTKDIGYLIKKAGILADREDYNELYDTYTKILAEHPELEEVEDKRDELLLKMGRYRDLIQLADYWISKGDRKTAKGYYLRAIAYKNLGEIENALKNIENAIKISKKAKYRDLEAEILYKLGRYEDAYEIIEKLHAKTPNTLLLKANILKEVGKYDESIELFNKLDKLGIKEASEKLAEIYIKIGKEKEAMEYLENAMKYSKDEKIYILGAKIAYGEGDFKKSLQFINSGIRKIANYPEAWIYKTLSLLSMGEYEESLNSVENLLKIEKKDEYYLIKAKILNKIGKYQEAYNILKNLDNVEFYGISSREEMGYSLYKMGRYEESIRIYEEINREDMVARCLYSLGKYEDVIKMKNTKEILEIKGDSYQKIGDRENAIKMYEEDIKNGNKNAMKKLANLYYDLSEFNKSYELYSKLDDDDSILKSAIILEKWGQYKDACEKYEKYYRSTEDSEIGLKSAMCFKKIGSLSKSLDILKNLDSERVIKERARIYYLLGEYPKAINELRNLEKEDFEVFSLLGDIYLSWSQPKRAAEYYKKSLEMKEDKNVMKSLARAYEISGNLRDASEIYMKCGDDKSFERAEEILKELEDKENLRRLYELKLEKSVDIRTMKNLAEIYEEENYEKALKLYEEIKNYEFSSEILRKIGKLYMEMGEYGKSEENLKKSLEMGEDSETYFYLGKLYSILGRYDDAKKMYMKSYESDELNKEICRLAILSGDVKTSFEYGEKIVDKINDGESWYLYAKSLSMIGDYEDAINAYGIAEEKGYDAAKELGKIYFKLGQYDRAYKILEKVNDDESKLILSLIHCRKGEYDKGEEILKSLENGDSMKYLGDIYFMRFNEGRDTVRYPQEMRDVRKITEMYKSSLKNDSSYSSSENIHNNMGVAYILSGDRARGVEHLEISGRDMINLLNSYIILGENESAEKKVDEAFGVYAKDPIYWNSVGVYHSLLGKYNDAMAELNKGEELADNPYVGESIIFNRAYLLLKLGMHKSALELLSRIKMRDAMLLRTYIFINLGKYEEGKKNIEDYLKKSDESILYYIDSYIEYKLGNYDKALKMINRAIVKNPKDDNLWELKGIILAKMERYDESLRALKVAQHINNDERIKINISSILILTGKYEKALKYLENVKNLVGEYNKGCSLAHLGRYEEGEKYFRKYYEKMKDEESLYNIYLCALSRGEPPKLKMKIDRGKNFYLADVLLSNYNVQAIISPRIERKKLVYSVNIKNLSGDTISPFVINPLIDSGVTISKSVGPIRPYDEEIIEFKTTKSIREMIKENSLIPSMHVEVVHKIYGLGKGAVDEVKVKNITNYAIEDILIKPAIPEGFISWENVKTIDKLNPREEKILKFALLPEEILGKIKGMEDKFFDFYPKFVEPEFQSDDSQYKLIFRIYPFEFNIRRYEAKYDVERAKKIIRKEKRKLLIREVGEYGEGIVSVER